ncbi:glycoside hydrolase family 15 protein [Geminicoccus roseus]|uniref:glycoside hydrolase family 15 protein n=1 Tax=Geminicoccus roseus TaxID=404900 RepID=UPI00040879B4|nr:glycoside hydrolase family 15 protein [Geminicoccus roseus]
MIEDYALIGSTTGAALVHRDGTIAWLALPRFDSEAMFASLLGDERHGCWKIGAAEEGATMSRCYRPGTFILETTIETGSGRATVIDFIAMPDGENRHRLIRLVRGEKGSLPIRTEIRFRFGYGAYTPWVQHQGDSIFAVAGPDAVRMTSNIPLDNSNFTSSAEFKVEAGEQVAFALEWYPSHHQAPPPVENPDELLAHASEVMRAWAGKSTYQGPYKDVVERSLLTLKALTYSPTGGIVAAPTTSLPEWPGGIRNWDYRFCWIRDAVLTIYALLASGYREEAEDWRRWLMRALAGSPDELQIMYGLHGERRLTEAELSWLPGFEDSRPVRIGNAAYKQRQLDVYGSVIAAFYVARRAGLNETDEVWPLECTIIEKLSGLWKEKDSGLWEMRGEERHFVHSKLMCWLAFHAMVLSVEEFGLEGPVDQWRATRDEIHADICKRGFNERRNSFVQYYGGEGVDAALLLMPLVGFLPIDDPRIVGTIDRIERELLRDGLVLRYLTEEAIDGLPPQEGAFLACSFWLCDVYAEMGRFDEAHALFDRLLALGNDLALFAEEYDPKAKRQLGNYPQAFSHLALINSAHVLARISGGAWKATNRSIGRLLR